MRKGLDVYRTMFVYFKGMFGILEERDFFPSFSDGLFDGKKKEEEKKKDKKREKMRRN